MTSKPPPHPVRKKKKRKKENSNALYAAVVGCVLLGAKLYFGSEALVRNTAADSTDKSESSGVVVSQSTTSPRGQKLVATPDARAPSSSRTIQETNSATPPLLADQCKTQEFYQCTRKVFSPEIKESDDGTSETASSCVSTSDDNMCVQTKTILNSTAHFQTSPESKKVDFEIGGRFNHEEYQCAFNQFGHPANPNSASAAAASSGVTLRVEGRELAQALRSLQKDCLARTDQPANLPAEESERALAGVGTEQINGEVVNAVAAEATPLTADLPPEQTQLIPPNPIEPSSVENNQQEIESVPNPEGYVGTPPLGSNDQSI